MRIILLLLGISCLAGSTLAQAQPTFPPLTGRVVDQAEILPDELERRLEAQLAAHERATTNQVVVATVSDLDGLPIEDYGYQLGRAWGIGQEGRDNGALLIVAPVERRVRIEVGYGLEGLLTDALGRTIIETAIIPRFRAGDFPGGVEAGIHAILGVLGGELEPEELTRASGSFDDETAGRSSPNAVGLGLQLVFMLLLAGFILQSLRSRMRGNRRGRRRGRVPIVWLPPMGGGGRGGFGGRGGGGFGGGGGGFGGGGASGSW
jgi:uncharacterized protein